MPMKQFQFKLVLLGESGVGKSCLVLRFVRGEFSDDQVTTIGATFLTSTLDVDDTIIKFEIWDTAGQERYHSLAPMYYRGAPAAIVVFDITSPESFAKAKTWVDELHFLGDPNIVIGLAGNKADLSEQRKVSAEDVTQYAQEKGLVYMETSAKDNLNVQALFHAIAKKVPRTAPPPRKVVNIDLKTETEKPEAGCCG